MREPVFPGWAEEQTPTPFLYRKENENLRLILPIRGVCRQIELFAMPNSYFSQKRNMFKAIFKRGTLTQLRLTFLSTVLMSMAETNVLAHAIEVENADGVTIYYNWKNSTELTVTYKGGGTWASVPNEYYGDVVIPETVNYEGVDYPVTSIDTYTFYQCNVKSVVLPNSITTIGNGAFSGCSSLVSVTIPENLTSINDYVFRDCSALISVVIPDGITYIGKNAFNGCSGLKSVTIPNSVTSLYDSSFEGCTGVLSLTLDCNYVNKLAKILTSIRELTLGSNVTSVFSGTLTNCPDLEKVNLNCREIGTDWFNGCTSLKEIDLGSNLVSIGSQAFSGCIGLTSVVIPEGVTSIGESAFRDCSNLRLLTLPNSLTSIGNSAFYGCKNLITMTIPNRVATIGDFAFYNTFLKSLTLGAGLQSVGESAFAYENTYGYQPAKVIWMTNTPPSGYKNAEGMINYVSNDLYSEFDNVKVYPFLSSMFEVDGVKYVLINPSERTCDAIDCVYDEQNAIVDIKPQAAYRGISLAVKNIQPYIFYGNTFVQSCKVEVGSDISQYAFFGCANMQTAVFGNTGNKDFSDFTGCFVGNDVNRVADYAFAGCAKLNNLIIDDREERLTLGSNGTSPLFADCPLDSVYIGGDISYQTSSANGYSPFYRNTSLRTVVITDQETEISPNEFYGCTNLQDFTVGDGVTAFGDWCFSGCLSLKSLSFGSLLTTIGREAFSDCAAVTRIVSKASTPPTCGTQAMDDINKWDCTLYVPSNSESDYREADQWKDFFFITEGAGEDGESPLEGDRQCATPTIALEDGKLLFNCETTSVIFHYQLYVTQSEQNVGNYVNTPSSCTVKVYASKDGYTDSAPATKTVEIRGLKGDVNGDGNVTAQDASLILQYVAKKITW